MNDRRARAVDLALLAIGVTVLWAIPHHIGSDGEVRLEALTALLRDGRLAAPRYSMVGPLFALPFHAIGQAALFNVTLFTLALAIVWSELRDVALLVLLVFASMFGNHVQVFYGEPFTALAVTIGVIWLSRGLSVRGWTAIVLGAVNTPASVVGVAAVALLEARRTRRLGPLAAPIAVAALACLENLVMRGGLLRTGYDSDAGFRTVMPYSGLPGFSYPMLFGLLAIFLSFGKGLVFFAPGLFIPPAKDEADRVRRIRVLLTAFVVGLVLVYARWWSWYGGNFWGPRFFLVASVPACVVLAGHLRSREDRRPAFNALLAVVLVLSFWVSVNGIVFDQSGLGICSRDDYALEALCHFTPEYSALWHPFVEAKVTPLGIVVLVVWAIACAWVGRDVFAQVGRDAAERVDARRR